MATEYSLQFKVPISGSDAEDGQLNYKTLSIKNVNPNVQQEQINDFMNQWDMNNWKESSTQPRPSTVLLLSKAKITFRKKTVKDLMFD